MTDMDFELDEDQRAAAGLAAEILGRTCDFDRRRGPDGGGDGYLRDAWRGLVEADLAGLTLPESLGGSGRGLVDAAAVCVEIGRTAAWVPYVDCVLSAAMPIAEFGTRAQQQRWLPGVLDGSATLTAALAEPVGDPRVPSAVATPQGAGWRLDGVRDVVPGAETATATLVPARTADGDVVVFLVPAETPGVSVVPQQTTAGRRTGRVVLAAVELGPDDVLAGPQEGRFALDRIVDTTTVGVVAQMAGLAAATVEMTASYVTSRQQFGRPIATFQSVGHRLADAFIDTRAITLTMWQAAWRVSQSLPARKEISIAKVWAAEGGQRIVHTAQHLHGGIGVDRDYPVHAYFLMAKELELYLGGAARHLDHIADELVAARLALVGSGVA